MNLDKLISKYLDGELTEREDELLRREISESPEKKELFDSATMIHLAIREDAESINPPEELVRDAEDAVLMKIMSQNAQTANAAPFRWRNYFAAAAVLLIAFSLSVFRIDNMQLAYRSEFSIAGDPLAVVEMLAPKKLASPAQKVMPVNVMPVNRNNSKAETQIAKDIAFASSSAERNAKTNNNSANNINAKPTKIDFPEPTATTDFAAAENRSEIEIIDHATEEINVSDYFGSNRNGGPAQNFSTLAPIVANGDRLGGYGSISRLTLQPEAFAKTQIIASTMFASDLLRGGFNNDGGALLNHFAQSVAYQISPEESYGLEFGFSQLTFSEMVSINVPVSQASSEGIVEAINPVTGEGATVSVPFKIRHSRTLYWGAAFYERLLLDAGDLTARVRFGAGGSNDGPLGYARLTGSYEVFSGFYITAGADGRLFEATLPSFNHSIAGDDMKSSLSLIYGLQFKF